jgi:hypothetical protein
VAITVEVEEPGRDDTFVHCTVAVVVDSVADFLPGRVEAAV